MDQLQKFKYFLLLLLLSITNSHATVKHIINTSENDKNFIGGVFLSNGFMVGGHYIEFEKHLNLKDTKKCYGKIFYPKFSGSNDYIDTLQHINNTIDNFIESYNVCNQRYNQIKTHYDIRSGSKDYFSVRFITKFNNQILRIDSLNFNKENGSVLSIDDILNSLSNNFLSQIITLGNFSTTLTWDELKAQISKKSIQFYIYDAEWYIIFNPKTLGLDVIDVKLPKHLLKSDKLT